MAKHLSEIEKDIDAASSKVERMETQLASIRSDLSRLRRQKLLKRGLERYYSFVGALRSACDRFHILRGGVIVIIPFAVSVIGFVAMRTETRNSTFALGIGGFLALVALFVLFGFLFYPSDETVRERIQSASDRCRSLSSRISVILEQNEELEHRFDRARNYYVRLTNEMLDLQRAASLEYRCQKLYDRSWKAMRSVEFEQYLEEVFVVLGYHVDETKITGDQGVDLVVEKNNFKVAIQVKGYENSVGNSAVQQAYAGMAHYSCRGCAVITNSRFTTGAATLARSTNCCLIHEDNFKDFVFGKLDLVKVLTESVES
jgi:hypothetical protein